MLIVSYAIYLCSILYFTVYSILHFYNRKIYNSIKPKNVSVPVVVFRGCLTLTSTDKKYGLYYKLSTLVIKLIYTFIHAVKPHLTNLVVLHTVFI